MKVEYWGKSYVFREGEDEFDRAISATMDIVAENEMEQELISGELSHALVYRIKEELRMALKPEEGDIIKIPEYSLEWNDERRMRIMIFLKGFDVEGYDQNDLKKDIADIVDAVIRAIKDVWKKKYVYETRGVIDVKLEE